MRKTISSKLTAVLLAVALIACLLVPQFAALAENSAAVLVRDMTKEGALGTVGIDHEATADGMKFSVEKDKDGQHIQIVPDQRDLSGKKYLYVHVSKSPKSGDNTAWIKLQLAEKDTWKWISATSVSAKRDTDDFWQTVNDSGKVTFYNDWNGAWLKYELSQFTANGFPDLANVDIVQFDFEKWHSSELLIGNVYIADSDEAVPGIKDYEKPGVSENPTESQKPTESGVSTAKVITLRNNTKMTGVTNGTKDKRTVISANKNGMKLDLNLNIGKNATWTSWHYVSMTPDVKNTQGKKYVYFRLQASMEKEKADMYMQPQFNSDAESFWGKIKKAEVLDLSNRAAGWKDAKVNEYGRVRVVSGNYWYRIPVEAVVSDGKTLASVANIERIAFDWESWSDGKVEYILSSIYAADNEKNIPNFNQNFTQAPTEKPIDGLIHSMKNADGFRTEGDDAPKLKYTPVVKNKMRLMEVTASKESNTTGVAVIPSDIQDISKAKYFYFYFEAPTASSTNIKLVLQSKAPSWYEGRKYGMLNSSNTGIGWIETDGSSLNLEKGFKGWIRVALSDCKETSDDKLTAKGMKNLDLIKICVAGAGPKAKGRAYYIGDIYAPANAKNVPNLPQTDKVATMAALIEDFETYAEEGKSFVDNGKTLWGVDGADDKLFAVSSSKGASTGSFALKLTAEADNKTHYTDVTIVDALDGGTLKQCVGKRYVTFHVSIPSSMTWKNDQNTDKNGDPCFSVKLGFRSQDDNQYYNWANAGGVYDNTGAKLLYDGASNYSDAVVLKGDVILPYGFSGWVVYDTQNFFPEQNAPYKFGYDIPGLNILDVKFSQAGSATGDLYLDSIYAFNEGDYIPGMTSGSSGVSPSTGSMSAVPFAMVVVVPACAAVTFWFVRKRKYALGE